MSFQMNTLRYESRFGVSVPNSFMTQETGSDKLLIMLPGRGYTCEHPVLYYLRRAALHAGWDVLSVQYGFQVGNLDFDMSNVAYLQDDVRQAVEPVLARGYSQVCIVGKSLGTPLAAELARTRPAANVSLILLTPIGGAVQGLGDIRTLAIIGTDDALYSAQEVAAYANHPTINWKVFEGLNHGLEFKDDWRASLAVLPEVISACEAFLSGH